MNEKLDFLARSYCDWVWKMGLEIQTDINVKESPPKQSLKANHKV
jgi:hypothetical protein